MHRHYRLFSAAIGAPLVISLSLLSPNSAAQQIEDEEDAEELVVQATRSGRRVQDEPIRVEVITREEIEEKIIMKPGNIAMIISETGGIRVQVTAPALGGSNVRVQGMNGRYTQILSDGLPLNGSASALGLLQIPPTDLGQVEVIKGAASALYGPAALGGVINLVSRRPGDALEGDLVLNATSQNGQDMTAYLASPLSVDWGASLVGGYHRQSAQDLDGDGWRDIPGYERWTIRPRLFWESGSGAKAYLTLGAMHEDRTGGTEPGRTTPDGLPFPQDQSTRRYDAGLVVEAPLAGIGTLHLRASATSQDHDHRFGTLLEQDQHRTLFAETSLSGKSAATSWIAGLAIQTDLYRSRSFAQFDYSHTSPALFAQVEQDLDPALTLAGSARLDAHSDYGTHLSPRFSLLYKPGPWKLRAAIGRGFYAPTPFVDETQAAGLSRLEPLRGLKAEVAESASLDIGYARGRIEANAILFASHVHDGTRLVPFASSGDPTGTPDRVRLVNIPGTTRISGAELLLRYRRAPFTLTASYVHTRATEPSATTAGRRVVPLTPRHTGGLVAMWERSGVGRLGFEAYYTGPQELEDNPYRTRSRPYVEMGLLGEIVIGPARLFLNAENILGVRQTRYDSLLLPSRAADGRWTVDAWGPTEGFVLNGGIRLRFGGD